MERRVPFGLNRPAEWLVAAISHPLPVHHHRGTVLLEALDRIVELARCHGVVVIETERHVAPRLALAFAAG